MTLRQSGKVDLYWNSIRVDSTPEEDQIVDINMSFDTIYFINQNGTIKQIEHRNEGEFELAEAEVVPISNFNPTVIFYQNIKNIGKSYKIFIISYYLQLTSILHIFLLRVTY